MNAYIMNVVCMQTEFFSDSDDLRPSHSYSDIVNFWVCILDKALTNAVYSVTLFNSVYLLLSCMYKYIYIVLHSNKNETINVNVLE